MPHTVYYVSSKLIKVVSLNLFTHTCRFDELLLLLVVLSSNPRTVIATDPTPPEPALPLLDWQTVQLKMQWGVIMLLGGGFAIADAVKVSC